MRSITFFVVLALSGAIAIFSVAETSGAAETLVVQSTVCSSATNTCFTNLQTAIDAASVGDTIEIKPGTYVGNFLVNNKNISINGTETAATFISGGGSNAALSISSIVGSMKIQKLTFSNAATGILIQNSPSVTVSNNVFHSATNAGVQSTGSASTQVINNVFYNNAMGILSDTTDISIINNIFSNNTTAINPNVNINGIKNNLFFKNGTIGPTIQFDSQAVTGFFGNIQENDPLFVNLDAKSLDFHLKAGTPAQDKGHIDGGTDKIDLTTADIGAYGGSNSDTIPASPVISSPTASGSAVSVSWTPNLAYQVGGYKFYSGSASGSASNSYETTADVGLITSYTLTAPAVITAPTGTPALTNEFASETLLLSWGTSSVTGATGYEIRYALDSGPTVTIDAGNKTFYELTGLVNAVPGTPPPQYDVYVIPYAQQIVYMAVTSYYGTNTNNKAFESDFSNEVSASFGGKVYGTVSNTITDYPEMIESPLNLPDSGCFIATAAFGYYSAPQVEALREFRDRYLMNNRLGKAFVNWYYRHGPAGAAFINAHPWLKPVVRTALLPAVGGALFLLHTPLPVKVPTVLLFMAIVAFLVFRKRISVPRGGSR